MDPTFEPPANEPVVPRVSLIGEESLIKESEVEEKDE